MSAVKTTKPKPKAKSETTATKTVELRAYSVDQFAAAYGISRAYAYRLVKEGKIRCATLGKRRLITTEAAEAYIASVTA